MNPVGKLRSQLRVSERARGVVTAVDGGNVSVSVGGAVQVFNAAGLVVGDEVVINAGRIGRVPGDVDVVEV
jgi:hypothetical protein